MENLITKHIDIWTSAQTQKTSGAGRGNHSANHKQYGIKKLRELILELAVRGKLVTQDPNDEPARVLLEKIAREKARLIKEGKLKKQEPLPEITGDEKSFELPHGWEWVRLGNVGETNIGLTYSPKDISDIGTPVLRSNNVQKGKLDLNDLVRVNIEIKNSVIVQEGDLLSCARNGSKALVGKTAQVTGLSEEMAFGAFMAIFRSIVNDYVLHFINSPLFRKMIDDVNTTTINQITQNNLKTTMFPLPPLTEQHRIVAKVDELMAMCDQLEQQQTDSNATHQTLVETLLATLTNVNNQDEFAEAWQRIADHFDMLFTTEHSIEHLKQTILQLAVMGKLVPQDPNDEPGSVLLKKIANEKARLIKEGKIKKQVRMTEIRDDENPFELPEGWIWQRLGNIGYTQTGGTPSKNNENYFGNDVPFIKPGDIYPTHVNYSNESLSFAGQEALGRTAPSGSILMVCIGTIGKCNFIDRDSSFNQQINSISPHIDVTKFLLLTLRSNYFQTIAWERSSSTTIAILNKGKWMDIVLPIPPLAEQHRIVNKVDELIAVCDTLTARLNEAQAIKIQLADAIVERAVS
jgi:type I restriction enzyme S subunit